MRARRLRDASTLVSARSARTGVAVMALVAPVWGCGAPMRATRGGVRGASEGAIGICPHARPQRANTELTVLPTRIAGTRWRPRWWAFDGDAGVRHVLAGGARATLARDVLTFGDDRFANDIVAAAPAERGWVFAARDGAVAASDGFLGPLRPLGTLGTSPHEHGLPRGMGRAALLDANARLYTTDGATPVARVTSLPDARVLTAIFASAQRGAAIVEGHGLFYTRDGGATFTRVDTGTEAAHELSLVEGALHTETTAGERLIADDGALRDPPPRTTGVLRSRALSAHDPEVLRFTRRIARGLVARYPALLERDYASNGVARPDGTLLAVSGRDVLVFDRATGHQTTVHAQTLPDERCELYGWGAGLAALCEDSNGETVRLFHSGNGERFTPVGAAWPRGPVRFSDDELHVAHPCAEDTPSAAQPRGSKLVIARAVIARPWCVYHAELGDSRPVGLPARTVVLGMHGETVLAADRGEGALLRELRTVQSDASDPRARRLTLLDGTALPEVSTARMLPDGTLIAVGVPDRAAPERRVLLRGIAGPSLQSLALPDGVLAADFADEQRGVAAGAHLGVLYRTTDGGANWTRIETTLTGAAENVALRPPEVMLGSDVVVRCDAWACMVGERVRVRGWDALPPLANAVIAAERTPAAGEFAPWNTSSGFGAYSCEEGAAPARPGSAHRAPRSTGAARGGPAVLHAGDAWASVTAEPRGNGRLRMSVRFRDATGHEAVTRLQDVTVPQPSAEATPPIARWALRAVVPAGALIERCVEPTPGQTECALLFASRRGGIAPLPPLNEFPGQPRVENVVPAPDGGLLVLFHQWNERVRLARVVHIAPGGAVRARRTIVLSAENHAPQGLAVRNGVSGFVIADEAEPGLLFFPLDPHVPDARVAHGPYASTAVCTRAALADTLHANLTSTYQTSMLDWNLSIVSVAVRVALEVTGAQLCLRAVDYPPDDEDLIALRDHHDPPVSLRLAATPDGTLVGHRDRDGTRVSLRCTP